MYLAVDGTSFGWFSEPDACNTTNNPTLKDYRKNG